MKLSYIILVIFSVLLLVFMLQFFLQLKCVYKAQNSLQTVQCMTTSLEVAKVSLVMTVADDIDIVVMLLHYLKDHLFEVFFIQ